MWIPVSKITKFTPCFVRLADLGDKVHNTILLTVSQVVPAQMADKLFEACGTDSYEKLDTTVKVTFLLYVVVVMYYCWFSLHVGVCREEKGRL